MDDNKDLISTTSDLNAGQLSEHSRIQRACLITAICHTLAILSSINLYRTGDLSNFSIHRLMNFVAFHPDIWRLNNLLVAASALSALYLFVCFIELTFKKKRIQSLFCLSLLVMAIVIQLNSQTTLMLLFFDCSYKYVFDPLANKGLLAFEGWKIVNQSLAHIFVTASALYGLAGFGISSLLTLDKSLSKWIGITGQILWSLGIIICACTLCSLIPLTILLILLATIAYIIWTVVIYVSIDDHKHRKELEAKNQTTKQN